LVKRTKKARTEMGAGGGCAGRMKVGEEDGCRSLLAGEGRVARGVGGKGVFCGQRYWWGKKE